MGRPRISIPPGTRFGKLTTTGDFVISKGRTKYMCRCDCGATSEPFSSHLLKGSINSCGCLRFRQPLEVWTELRLARLTEMAGKHTPTEIARAVGLGAKVVSSKMLNMGLVFNNEPAVSTPLKPIRFPWFEDITREEARVVMAGAPKSGAFRVHGVERFSGMGCSAGMCAGWR